MAEQPLYRTLKTVEQVAEESSFSEDQLRQWIKRAEELGLAPAIVRPVPRRVFIDIDEFNRWLEGKRVAPLPSGPRSVSASR